MTEEARDAAREQFSQVADAYVTSESHANGDDLPLLAEWLDPQPSWRVLDIATGGGHVARTLAPLVASVVATDLTPEMLDAARAALEQAGCDNVEYAEADAEALPFGDAEFDAVVYRIAPHHFGDPARFVAEVARVLKPGGRFVLIDNVAPDDAPLATLMNAFERLRDPSHVRALSVPEWQHLFSAEGLKPRQAQRSRKVYEFASWVARSATPREQIELVEESILGMPRSARAYFAMCVSGGRVLSLEVDRWMAMVAKTA
jgi:ubiquinone/menaquinone biosynthesis C-methylase UbiE